MDFWCNFCCNFWGNFCHVIFIVIFSTSTPNWEDIWCNFCCSLYESFVIFFALEKYPIYDSPTLRDAHKLFGKNAQAEREAYWHIACLSEDVLSSDFDKKWQYWSSILMDTRQKGQQVYSGKSLLPSCPRFDQNQGQHHCTQYSLSRLCKKGNVEAARKVLNEMHYDHGCNRILM